MLDNKDTTRLLFLTNAIVVQPDRIKNWVDILFVNGVSKELKNEINEMLANLPLIPTRIDISAVVAILKGRPWVEALRTALFNH